MKNMGVNVLPAEPHPRPCGWGQKVKIQLLTEQVHATYRIKKNSPMQQHGSKYLPVDTPLTLWMGPVGQLQHFQNMVMLHIKIKRTTNTSPW